MRKVQAKKVGVDVDGQHCIVDIYFDVGRLNTGQGYVETLRCRHLELTRTEGQYNDTTIALSVWSHENFGVIIPGLQKD